MGIFALLVIGAVIGGAGVLASIRIKLSRVEWTYLVAFYEALLEGRYETHENGGDE